MGLIRQDHGFTIVELVIVIVTLGILVMIVTTTYSGAQARAFNARVLTSVAHWEKILKSYEAVKGYLPMSDYNCLANASTDFPAGSGLAAGECIHGFPSAPSFSAVYSNALTTDLKSVLGNDVRLPSGYIEPISGSIDWLDPDLRAGHPLHQSLYPVPPQGRGG